MHDAYPNSNGEVLSKLEASRLIGISTRTLDSWMKKRIVPFSKLPSGLVRFRRSQLLAFIEHFQQVALPSAFEKGVL
jgi:hypothetical protein